MGLKIVFLLLVVLAFALVGYMNYSDIQEIASGYSQTTDAQEDLPEVAVTSHAGTYEDPVILGEAAKCTSPLATYFVSATDVIRGVEANDIVLSGSEFNDLAPEGYEYFLVNVSVKYGNGENSVIMSSKDFKAFCEGVECNLSYALLPDDMQKFSKGGIASDGKKHGWLVYLIPQNKTVLLEFNPVELPSKSCYIDTGA
ncbi:hypothetical protein J2755_001151 [Methanohalophilus levihalophilus]|uniref:DUF4352 domain-containing protein n=1 Tax=Methanohalophilus levihalophilus TaxID=1431282 RepID=UPI001AE77404|nr:DUF4352 domain-containing protein [Methanohalophilus levihalophilus]MBP2030217.1 hypothetical protein [Methanohalophilus levihalophilus]